MAGFRGFFGPKVAGFRGFFGPKVAGFQRCFWSQSGRIPEVILVPKWPDSRGFFGPKVAGFQRFFWTQIGRILEVFLVPKWLNSEVLLYLEVYPPTTRTTTMPLLICGYSSCPTSNGPNSNRSATYPLSLPQSSLCVVSSPGQLPLYYTARVVWVVCAPLCMPKYNGPWGNQPSLIQLRKCYLPMGHKSAMK